MKAALLSILCLAAYVCNATMPDDYRLRLMTPRPDPAFQTNRMVAARAESLIALPKTEDDSEPPALLSFAWDVSAVTSSNGAATGYLLWRSLAGGAPVVLLTTGLAQADVEAVPGTYYVSATNKFGASALSAGLVWPKPTTNVYTLSAAVQGVPLTNWPAQVWQVQNLPWPQQYIRIRYTATNGGWRASCVFSASLLAAPDAWETFLTWPPFQTAKTNIAVNLRKETF